MALMNPCYLFEGSSDLGATKLLKDLNGVVISCGDKERNTHLFEK